LAVFTASGQHGSAQQPSAASQAGAVTPRSEIYPQLDDAFLRWPLPAGAERYGTIDGKRMHKERRRADANFPALSRRGSSKVLGPDHRNIVGRRERAVAGSEVHRGRFVRRQNSAAGSRTAVDAANLGRGHYRRWQDRSDRKCTAVLRR
jgi:hypothetical protein